MPAKNTGGWSHISDSIDYFLEPGFNRIEMNTALDPELIGEIAKLCKIWQRFSDDE